jgi:glycosyltransferase involved in cell wall biosynthesis
VVAGNWADGNVFHPPTQKDWGGKLTVIYPGNLGLGHDVETLISAVSQIGDSEDIRFLFVGGGAGLDQLREACRAQGSSVCDFLPYEDPCRLAKLRFSVAHIGLVSQRESCTGLLVPSKIYPLMASGLPLVFVGPSDATPNLLIERHECGWRIRNGDPGGLVKALRELAENRDLVLAAGVRARNAFLREHDVSIGARRVCCSIIDVPFSMKIAPPIN